MKNFESEHQILNSKKYIYIYIYIYIHIYIYIYINIYIYIYIDASFLNLRTNYHLCATS